MQPVIEPNVQGQSEAASNEPAQTDTITVSKTELANLVNQAVSSHLKRQKQPDINAAIQEAMSKVQPSEPVKPTVKSPEAIALEQLRAELAAERQAAREAKAYSDLQQHLSGRVKPEAVGMVADLIFRARKQIDIQADGSAYFKHGEDLLTMEDGVSQFLQSKEAALFLPAPTATNLAVKGKAPTALRQGSGPVEIGTPEFKKLPHAEQMRRATEYYASKQ